MPKFSYVALDSRGQESSGLVEAASTNEAIGQLRQAGFFPTNVYEEGKGLDNVFMSWGHDEYLYQVVKDYLPPEALYMIRYHSFYPAHRDGEYDYLMNDCDREMFKWVRAFNPYDLYTKSHERPNLKELRPFYDGLISEYFPAKLRW